MDEDGKPVSENETREGVQLKKQLGLLNGVAIIIGTIIGSGIFVSPKGILAGAGSPGASLIIWTLCGVIALIGSMCYAELGTSIVQSGADYSYIREAFGDLPAFLYIWAAVIIIIPSGVAIAGLTFANYILQPAFPDCHAPGSAVSLVAAMCITILTFTNCVNVKWATRVQSIFTATKLLALAIIIVTGLVKMGLGSAENFREPFVDTSRDAGKMALAFYSGFL